MFELNGLKCRPTLTQTVPAIQLSRMTQLPQMTKLISVNQQPDMTQAADTEQL